MSLIRVKGVPPWDGEYEFEEDRSFTTRELRWIKQIAGYLPASLDEGLEGGDADLVIALVVIAMQRTGKIAREDVLTVADRFADEPVGEEDSFLTIIRDEAEEVADELPPASTLEREQSSTTSSDEKGNGSGPHSSSYSDLPDATLEPTGALSSDTSPELESTTSAT